MKILFAPYAKKLRDGDRQNPKDYPFAKELVDLLEKKGHEILQVGCSGEHRIASNVINDLSFTQMTVVIQACDTFIGVDSYLQHHAWFVGKKGIVLWGQSDPLIFGHDIHVNLLKNRDNLRIGYDRFNIWEGCPNKPDAFVSPEEVLTALIDNF